MLAAERPSSFTDLLLWITAHKTVRRVSIANLGNRRIHHTWFMMKLSFLPVPPPSPHPVTLPSLFTSLGTLIFFHGRATAVVSFHRSHFYFEFAVPYPVPTFCYRSRTIHRRRIRCMKEKERERKTDTLYHDEDVARGRVAFRRQKEIEKERENHTSLESGRWWRARYREEESTAARAG